jgi:hypothetical protein
MNDDKFYYASGKLIRMKRDGYDIKITSGMIKVKGYREWNPVTYMRTNESRLHCVEWVLSLIKDGVIREEKKV